MSGSLAGTHVAHKKERRQTTDFSVREMACVVQNTEFSVRTMGPRKNRAEVSVFASAGTSNTLKSAQESTNSDRGSLPLAEFVAPKTHLHWIQRPGGRFRPKYTEISVKKCEFLAEVAEVSGIRK